MEYITIACKAAENWHKGQFRKNCLIPYYTHPKRVADRIARHLLATIVMVCAAVLHDVMEDCGITAQQIIDLFDDPVFGKAVADMVQELTNPSKQHPELLRAAKKALDREYIAHISLGARMIKLADRTDNMREVSNCDAEFVRLYLSETELLKATLTGTDKTLEDELQKAMEGVHLWLKLE